MGKPEPADDTVDVMDRGMLADARDLTDQELLARLALLAQQERDATAALVAHLSILDERRLHLGEGHPSLFAYCTQVLHLSEHAAYNRIEAARAARRFPVIVEMLANGDVSLTAVRLLAPHLTPANHLDSLAAIRYKNKREVEEYIAQLRPLTPVPSTIRKLPESGTGGALTQSSGREETRVGSGSILDGPVKRSGNLEETAHVASSPPSSPHPTVLVPLGLQRYRVQFTAGPETIDKLRLAQDLLRHQIPDGDLAQIVDRALTLLLEQMAKEKFASAGHPREHAALVKQSDVRTDPSRTGSRHIPVQVKRAVWLRDGGRCAYVAHNGRRCNTRAFLEFHHVVPYAGGGDATVENIELRCRAHNQYEAVLPFGEIDFTATHRRAGPRVHSMVRSEVSGSARAGPE